MLNFKTKLLLPLLLLASNLFAQQKPTQWATATSGGYTYKYVVNDPTKARFYTLKNGLTVILSTSNKSPRIQCYIATKAGSKTDPASHTGLAHYLEHMLFKGTDKYGSLNWAKEKPELDKIDTLYETYNHTTDTLKRKAIYQQIDSVSGIAAKYAIANEYDKMLAAMGAQGTNAFTSFEQTVYTDDVPANATDKYLAVQAERFRNPVFRIFHTELEAVYEEKNIGMDSDSRKVFEKLFASLFKNNNYGRQTTIGTVEHLKNPSLVAIRQYYNNYYVPNNMGIIMAGDFDANAMIKKVDNAFSFMQSNPIPAYTFDAELPINQPIIEEVIGPDAENVTIGFRLPGNKDKDVLLADLVGQILTNGKAGLMDLNLVKKQKLLRASASAYTLIDYGVLYMQGNATQGQSLEDVKTLMLGEIENLKKGNFDNNLITSIVNNQKKNKILALESYSSRAENLMDAFTSEIDWKNQVAYTDQLSKITKKDIVAFANKYFADNYVAIYKRMGEDKNVVKVVKPSITAVETNRDAQSEFVKAVNQMPAIPVKPVFLNYDKDFVKSNIGPAQLLYIQNKENQIFRLQYRFDIGSWNNKKLDIAAQYLQFLSTNKTTAEDITKAFYKIACSFNVSTGREFTTIKIEGLQENFVQAVSLFEYLLKNCKANQNALIALKARIMKSRTDAKASKGAIMQGLTNYARYGAKNPFNYVLSDTEMANIIATELVNLLHNLSKHSHKIIYYGPQSLINFKPTIQKLHPLPLKFTQAAPSTLFTPSVQNKNQVLYADYDMVQAEIMWLRNNSKYNASEEPLIGVFNNYFGYGMSAIVFQTIRESKALAYNTYAYYITPDKKNDPFVALAYVGCQADKFNEAVTAMNELLTTLPKLNENLNNARIGIKKDIETERITQDNIIFNYLAAQRKGVKTDIRQQTYARVNKINFEQIKQFYQQNIANKPYTYCILASENKISESDIAKLGEVKKLSLKEIFGY
ncbi:MAG: insulinase family protein [Sphingobacteriales bacterium]|nr:MAG: insulinase family protein [Sphingobacteriales bacterium]